MDPGEQWTFFQCFLSNKSIASPYYFTCQKPETLEKEMATHSNILAWRIPWTEEPGKLQSMRSQESNMTGTEHTCSLRPILDISFSLTP